MRSTHARRGTFGRGWKVGEHVSSLTAVIRVCGLLRHPTRTRHNSNGLSRSTQKQLMKRQTKNSTSTATVVTVLPSQGCSLGCTVCNGGECIWGTSHGRTVRVALPSRRVVAPEGSVAAHPPSGPRSRSASSRSRFRRHAETCTPRHAHRERDAASTGGVRLAGAPRCEECARLVGRPHADFFERGDEACCVLRLRDGDHSKDVHRYGGLRYWAIR